MRNSKDVLANGSVQAWNSWWYPPPQAVTVMLDADRSAPERGALYQRLTQKIGLMHLRQVNQKITNRIIWLAVRQGVYLPQEEKRQAGGQHRQRTKIQ